jgi:carboxypeptidase C (cathepsin A)
VVNTKVQAIKDYGIGLEYYGKASLETELYAKKMSEERSAVWVSPWTRLTRFLQQLGAADSFPASRQFWTCGYYDYATPFFDAEDTFWRHGIDMSRVTMTYYEAGHMVYLHHPSLEQVSADIRAFLKGQ